MKMWFDHNNFRKFMKQKKLNQRQVRWALTLTVYDFEIFHKSERTNFTDESSRRSDYKETSTLNIKLLSSLQNKLALSISMRNSERIFNDAFELTNVSKLESVLNARDFMKMLENASTRSNAQKFESSANVWDFNQMLMNVLTRSNAHFKLNIKYLSLSQNRLTSSKNMQNFLKMFDDVFKIADVQKLKSATSVRNSEETFKNVTSRLNVHVNAFIWQESSKESLMQDNRKTSLWANFVYQLTNIQVVVSRKKIKNLFKTAYKELARFMKCFIKKLQNKDSFVQQLKLKNVEFIDSRRERADDWAINFEDLIKHENKLYVLENSAIKEKLICRNHDDSLIEHFDAKKILKLF